MKYCTTFIFHSE